MQWGWAWVALGLGFFGVAAAAWWKRSASFERRSPLLSALIPTWRFFELPDPCPELLVRVHPAEGAVGPWLPAIDREPRPLHALLWNPWGNLALAAYGLVDQLVSDVADRGAVEVEAMERLETYAFVRRVAEYYLLRGGQLPPRAGYQLQLGLIGADGGYTEVFTSSIYGAAEAPAACP